MLCETTPQAACIPQHPALVVERKSWTVSLSSRLHSKWMTRLMQREEQLNEPLKVCFSVCMSSSIRAQCTSSLQQRCLIYFMVRHHDCLISLLLRCYCSQSFALIGLPLICSSQADINRHWIFFFLLQLSIFRLLNKTVELVSRESVANSIKSHVSCISWKQYVWNMWQNIQTFINYSKIERLLRACVNFEYCVCIVCVGRCVSVCVYGYSGVHVLMCLWSHVNVYVCSYTCVNIIINVQILCLSWFAFCLFLIFFCLC